MDAVQIADRLIGRGQPCLVIAEAGVNHNGQVELAKRLIDAAAAAGADAVKFQTFDAGKLADRTAPKAAYQLRTTDRGESQLDMLRRLELPHAAYGPLQARAARRRLFFFSSPFDEASADFLERLDVPAFKIASGEITDVPLLRHIARKGRPVILSTGMSTLREVREAVEVIRRAGNEQVILLHCVSNYPADPADANLRAMRTMAKACGAPVGYSDHTPGIEVALAAVALGACVIEKHLTLDRSLPGPDHQASLEPGQLRALVRGIRTVEAALGHGRKEPARSEAATAAVVRKSVVAARRIPTGTALTARLLAAKRPGTGWPPSRRDELIGRRTKTDIPRGAMLTRDMLV